MHNLYCKTKSLCLGTATFYTTPPQHPPQKKTQPQKQKQNKTNEKQNKKAYSISNQSLLNGSITYFE